MLILFQKESCPFCAKVRRFLSENNVSYVSQSSETGSASRELLKKLGGQDMVPFLMDADKGVALYESADIIAYVQENYVA